MTDFHKELLTEIIDEWPVERVEIYIIQLEVRQVELNDWIKHLRTIRRKKAREAPVDTGIRGGP